MYYTCHIRVRSTALCGQLRLNEEIWWGGKGAEPALPSHCPVRDPSAQGDNSVSCGRFEKLTSVFSFGVSEPCSKIKICFFLYHSKYQAYHCVL